MSELNPLYDKKCSCTICGHHFTSKKLRSSFIKMDHYETDFCPIYQTPEHNPMLYHIYVCPKCGYSFSNDFSPYFPPHSKNNIHEKVGSQWKPQSFSNERTRIDAIKTYKLAVYCALIKQEKHIVIAGMYLRISWLYRSLHHSKQEQRFMKLACKEYIEAYISQDYQGTQTSEVKVMYLIGELSRRTNNGTQAGKYFSKIIEQQSRSLEPRIVEMAKERWFEMRSERETKLMETNN